MTSELICVECPEGCRLSVESSNSKVTSVIGNKCPKGKEYAVSEIENPLRILTSAVITKSLEIKMVPVRTDGPIPKARLFEAMAEIKNICIKKPIKAGEVIQENFILPGINLISTRDCS